MLLASFSHLGEEGGVRISQVEPIDTILLSDVGFFLFYELQEYTFGSLSLIFFQDVIKVIREICCDGMKVLYSFLNLNNDRKLFPSPCFCRYLDSLQVIRVVFLPSYFINSA